MNCNKRNREAGFAGALHMLRCSSEQWRLTSTALLCYAIVDTCYSGGSLASAVYQAHDLHAAWWVLHSLCTSGCSVCPAHPIADHWTLQILQVVTSFCPAMTTRQPASCCPAVRLQSVSHFEHH